MYNFFKISLSKILLSFFAFFIIINCEKNNIDRNPYLNEIKFNYEINLNFPEFDALRYVGGSKKINQIGLNGVILFNFNGNTFLAWEATCANHIIKECSELYIEGVLAKCSCEDFQYSLATGQLINPKENINALFGMLNFQVFSNGNILRITN